MKTTAIAAATTATVLALSPTVAHADNPSFRYCEGGYVNQDVGFDGETDVGDLTAAFETDSGSGFRGACVFELLAGVYLHGEYTQSDFDFEGVVGGDTDVSEAFASEAELATLRLGAGLAVPLPVVPITAYGQASYTNTSFDGNFGSLASEDLVGDGDFDGDQNGYDIEVGGRALLLERLDLGAFLRYTDVGAVSVPETIEDIEDDEDLRAGVTAAFRVFGPAWLSARYEEGDVDTLFAGLRVAF